MPVLIRGFVVDGLPVVFGSLQLATEARFPSKQLVIPYSEEEADQSYQLDDQLDETN